MNEEPEIIAYESENLSVVPDAPEAPKVKRNVSAGAIKPYHRYGSANCTLIAWMKLNLTD